MSLREDLTEQGEWMCRSGHPSSLQSLICEHGEDFAWSRRPDDVPRGRAKECFTNATHLVFEREGWRYAEGYFMDPSLPIPIYHAWCVKPDGTVVDPTLGEPGDTDCAFCLGDGEITRACEWDEDDGEETDWETVACFYCGGTGEDPDPNPDREGTEYVGVTFSAEEVRLAIIAKGAYGLVEDLPDIISKREGAAA